MVIILAYVDDITILGTPHIADRIKEELKRRLNITDLGDARLVIGVTISHDKGHILLGQGPLTTTSPIDTRYPPAMIFTPSYTQTYG